MLEDPTRQPLTSQGTCPLIQVGIIQDPVGTHSQELFQEIESNFNRTIIEVNTKSKTLRIWTVHSLNRETGED